MLPIGMNFCMLTVFDFSILQPKLGFLLPHDIFTDNFFVGVVTRGMVKRLAADLAAFTASQLSATINRTLILHHSLLPVM
jgi:hypothetical protein